MEEGRPDDKTVAKISLKNTEISSKSRFFTRSRKKKATAKSVRKHSSVEFVKQVEEKTQVADQSRKMDASGKSQRTASHYRKKKSASQPIVDQSKDSLIRSAKVDRTVKTQVDDSSVKPRSNGVLGSQATQPKSARTPSQSAQDAAMPLAATPKGSDEHNAQTSTGRSYRFVRDDNSTSSSFRRLRHLSERAVRKVKTFVSRPIKQTTLQRFLDRLEAKKQAEESGRISDRELKRGDDVFPKPIQRSKSSDLGKEKSARDTLPVKSIPQPPARSPSAASLSSGCQVIFGNNDNNGKLFLEDGQPFWTEQRKPTESDLPDTEDDLQMNADVALDVCEGKVKLVNMPTIPVVLDPMNELVELMRRDQLFFCRDVLFGNSVRSMINLSDNSSKTVPILRRRKGDLVTFTEPSYSYNYRRDRPTDLDRWPFEPGAPPSALKSLRLRRRRSRLRKKKGDGEGDGASDPTKKKVEEPKTAEAAEDVDQLPLAIDYAKPDKDGKSRQQSGKFDDRTVEKATINVADEKCCVPPLPTS